MLTDGPSSRQWFLRYKVEVVFLILLAAGAIGGDVYIRHAEYVGGMKNLGAKGFVAFIQTYGALVLASLGFILWEIIQCFRTSHTGRRASRHAAFLIAAPVILIGGWMIMAPLNSPFLRGFEQWVRQEVDTDAIQQWLATEGRNCTCVKGSLEAVFGEQLPPFLVPLKQGQIWFPDPASEGGLRVEFLMGGALHGWELVVGLPDMPMPKEGTTRRHIEPGVYIVDE
jgi:hypothetical protein